MMPVTTPTGSSVGREQPPADEVGQQHEQRTDSAAGTSVSGALDEPAGDRRRDERDERDRAGRRGADGGEADARR